MTKDTNRIYADFCENYELIDAGGGQKLERWGEIITIRPERQACFKSEIPFTEWEKQAHWKFKEKTAQKGTWQNIQPAAKKWEFQTEELTFQLELTQYKHIGIFPEQKINWTFIEQTLNPESRFLNLFAYTGGSSIAARAAGADVTHVDSIKQVVTWANENMVNSKLDNIRWMVDDALKFAKKEIRRGNKYQGIILDPPAFGHGPNGEKWKLEDNILEMMDSVLQLLDTDEHLLILNAYSLGFSALVAENLLKPYSVKHNSELSIGELYIPAKSGVKLPLGVWGRLTKGA